MLKRARGIECEDRNCSCQDGTVLTFNDSAVSIQESPSRKHQLKRKSVFDEGKQRIENPSISLPVHF